MPKLIEYTCLSYAPELCISRGCESRGFLCASLLLVRTHGDDVLACCRQFVAFCQIQSAFFFDDSRFLLCQFLSVISQTCFTYSCLQLLLRVRWEKGNINFLLVGQAFIKYVYKSRIFRSFPLILRNERPAELYLAFQFFKSSSQRPRLRFPFCFFFPTEEGLLVIGCGESHS